MDPDWLLFWCSKTQMRQNTGERLLMNVRWKKVWTEEMKGVKIKIATNNSPRCCVYIPDLKHVPCFQVEWSTKSGPGPYGTEFHFSRPFPRLSSRQICFPRRDELKASTLDAKKTRWMTGVQQAGEAGARTTVTSSGWRDNRQAHNGKLHN